MVEVNIVSGSVWLAMVEVSVTVPTRVVVDGVAIKKA